MRRSRSSRPAIVDEVLQPIRRGLRQLVRSLRRPLDERPDQNVTRKRNVFLTCHAIHGELDDHLGLLGTRIQCVAFFVASEYHPSSQSKICQPGPSSPSSPDLGQLAFSDHLAKYQRSSKIMIRVPSL